MSSEQIRGAGNQRERILAALRAAPYSAVHPGGAGRWLSIPDILHMGIAQYGTRILELRRAGHVIVNYREWSDVEGCYHSWFRLVDSVPEKAEK